MLKKVWDKLFPSAKRELPVTSVIEPIDRVQYLETLRRLEKRLKTRLVFVQGQIRKMEKEKRRI